MSQVLLVQPRTEDGQGGGVLHLRQLLFKLLSQHCQKGDDFYLLMILKPWLSVALSHPRSWGLQILIHQVQLSVLRSSIQSVDCIKEVSRTSGQ